MPPHPPTHTHPPAHPTPPRPQTCSIAELMFESFELHFGYSWCISPSDAVYVIAGLLAQHSIADNVQEAEEDFW